MASRLSSAGRATRSAGSRHLTTIAQQAVERAGEAKQRVREAKAELKSLRKLAKAAKKAAKAALKKMKAARPAAPTVPGRVATARAAAAAAPSPKSRRKPAAVQGAGRRGQPAEVAHSVIRRMRKDEAGAAPQPTPPVAARKAEAAGPRSADSAGSEAQGAHSGAA